MLSFLIISCRSYQIIIIFLSGKRPTYRVTLERPKQSHTVVRQDQHNGFRVRKCMFKFILILGSIFIKNILNLRSSS